MIIQDNKQIYNNTTITKRKNFSYAKWGYIFLIPFFLIFFIFTLIPLFSTLYYSFFEYYLGMGGLTQVGPNFVFLDNYFDVISKYFFKYFLNTIIIWLMGFIPQLIVSLLLAVLFTDLRLKLKATGFFKIVIYMPNLVMASAFGMLFFTLFSSNGPVANMIVNMGLTERFDYRTSVWITRGIIALMNFLMWFGNTTILLMAGIMGIDTGLFEAARIDGANAWKIFFKVTLPLLMPIFLYVLLTSFIGGLQLFDIPHIFTQGSGNPNMTSYTLIMFLNALLGRSKNYGAAGATSILMFIITIITSVVLFMSVRKNDKNLISKKRIKGNI